jgi:hypothetical protein
MLGDWGSGVQISPLRPMKSKPYHSLHTILRASPRTLAELVLAADPVVASNTSAGSATEQS